MMQSELKPGAILDERYRIYHQIGKGGLAVIYRAQDLRSGKEVVLKVLRPDAFSLWENGVERLQHEAEVLVKLNHPNILRYLDFQQGQGQAYLVVEWIPGENLSKRMSRRTKPYSVREVTPWIGALCDALNYLGEHDIVHRDLKPGNILITPDDRLVLIDFNVAMDLTRAARDPHARKPIGTAAYAAPEQMAKRAVDARADVYALGVMIYELLTWSRPFSDIERNTSKETRWTQLKQVKSSQDPPSLASRRSGLPDDIVAIVDKSLKRQPELRWSHAGEMWKAWLQALGAPLDTVENASDDKKTGSDDSSGEGLNLRMALAVMSILVIVLVGLAGGIFIFGGDSHVTPIPTISTSTQTSLPGSDLIVCVMPDSGDLTTTFEIVVVGWDADQAVQAQITLQRPDGMQTVELDIADSLDTMSCGDVSGTGFSFEVTPETGESPGNWYVAVAEGSGQRQAATTFRVSP